MNTPSHNTKSAKYRVYLIGFALFLTISALLGRLFYVQVAQSEEHLKSVRTQSIRRIRTNPVRGGILASDGTTELAGNEPRYSLGIHPSEMRQPGPRSETIEHILQKVDKIADIIGRENPLSENEVKNHLRLYPALPLTVYNRLNPVERARIAELTPRLSGISLNTHVDRDHAFPNAASHILGFTGRRRPTDQFDKEFSYIKPQLQGRAGLEKTFNEELKGKGGAKLVRVDTSGYIHETLDVTQPPQPGNDIVLTIDADAQRIASKLLQGEKGAIVVINVRTGAVIAMASAPSYNLNKLDSKRYSKLAHDEETRPLQNRAVQESYLPGSIVKPFIGLSALDSGAIEPDDTFTCEGSYQDFNISCWLSIGHGELTLVEALQHSCNPFFINAALETGLPAIQRMFEAAGFAQKPDIPLPRVAKGVIGSIYWARRKYGRGWLPVDTGYLAIGQFGIKVSPLQAALATAAIANDGTMYSPYLVQRIRNPAGQTVKKTTPEPQQSLSVSQDHLAEIQEGMYRVVNAEEGTGKNADNSALELAGKTGTAEVIGRGEEDYNNTWFTCYGPAEAPRYAMTILIEDGNSGGSTAAPLAAEFFTKWLEAR